MRTHLTSDRVRRVAVVAVALAGLGSIRLDAQQPGRFLGREEIRLLGLGLRVEPEQQTVPKDVATIVSALLHLPPAGEGSVSPFAPGTLLRATLRGPSLTAPLELTAEPNTPFTIPPLSVPGIHTLDGIRLEVNGQVLLRGTPETAVIEVLEKLLVTEVTTRPLTAQEIREKGIVFDQSNFQAYNFTAAFAVKDTPIKISFPVVLPTLQSFKQSDRLPVDLTGFELPKPPRLDTIIPDTLAVQRVVPNMAVTGFVLQFPDLLDREIVAPPIPGVVVIPGQIGFLNQYFSALLMVGNAAPSTSNLVVSDLQGELLLPAGPSGVVGAADQPLRMAVTAGGPSPQTRAIRQPGPDGTLGSGDDIGTIAPGQTATAEFLIEGRREGTHVIEFAITGTLHGLPGGPITVNGRAAGSVLVRNPSFSLTFTHPDTVQEGEPYTLDVTVTNTSASPANFVSVSLSGQHVSGAAVVGDPTRTIESIPPDDSATVSFSLVSQVTGRVFAATLDSDDNVAGRFALKAGVGELGVPVSPDSLVLPPEANALPADLRRASLGLLGKAWAVATAPVGALPAGVPRFSKKIVYDRAIEVAEAGFRHSLHESLEATATHLFLDVGGNTFARLADRTPNASERQFAESDYRAFDTLRRLSVRGDVFAAAIGRVLGPEVTALGPAAFHQQLGERASWRAPSLSVVAWSSGGPLPVRVLLMDSGGRQTGAVDEAGRIVKGVPFSDVIEWPGDGPVERTLSLIASLPQGAYQIAIEPRPGVAPAPFSLSVVYPDADGQLQHAVFDNLSLSQVPSLAFAPDAPWRLAFDVRGAIGTPAPTAPNGGGPIVEPAPSVLGVVQQKTADVITCNPGIPPIYVGRVVAVLFNKEMPASSVQDGAPPGTITRYLLDDNQIVGVALQPGRRIAFLALRDPVGPYVPRAITFENLDDGRGHVLTSQTVPIEATVDNGAVLSGQVLQADGTPVPAADVRLVFVFPPRSGCGTKVVSAKPTGPDGRYALDFVSVLPIGFTRIQAVDPATGDFRNVDFTIQRAGQRLNVNVVMLGRGTIAGRTLDEAGEPLEGTQLRITSLTEQSQVATETDRNGQFSVSRIPVGSVLIEAVHVPSRSRGTFTAHLPLAGGTVTRDLVLIEEEVVEITTKFGALTGHVLLSDGRSPIAGVPVIATYISGSQSGVDCPLAARECAVATTTTDANGAFAFARIVAGQVRLDSFNRVTLQQGRAMAVVPETGTVDVNLLLGAGLGTVRGTVLNALGQPVAGARVGGGLSLTTTDAAGAFVLRDVPVGQREIVAVSDALAAKGAAVIDIVQAGQEVDVTIVLDATGGIAGRVLRADGVTPVAGQTVHLFTRVERAEGGGGVVVAATAVTDGAGRYTIDNVPLNAGYELSAFLPDFSDGNIIKAPLRFNGQLIRGDIVFRGRGSIRGTISTADGTAPLRATVGVSGDRVVVGGGLIGVKFEHVKNFAIAESSFADGSFAFSGIFVGPFTVQAAGAFSPDPISVEGSIPADGATVDLDLRLTATSRVAGTVVQPDGFTPVGPNVVVRFKSEAFRTICTIENTPQGKVRKCVDIPQGIQEENAVTDANGAFVMPLVNAGRFTLTATDPATGLTGQLRAQVSPGQDGEFVVRLLKTSSLTVRVFRNDTTTPVPGARVEIRQLAHPFKSVTRTASADGSVVVSGGDAFSEGDLVVLATDLSNGFAGRATGRLMNTDTAVTVNVYLFDASGTVTGTVFRADGLTPVPNAEVVISNHRGALAFIQTDANGHYEASVIPVGAFSVDVFEAATARLGFASGRVDFDQQETLVNVTQAAVGVVTGNVLAAGTLAPLKLWNVTLIQQAPSGRLLPFLHATTGVDGGFEFPGTTEGAFTLIAERNVLGLRTGVQGRLEDEGDVVDIPIIVAVPTPEFGRLEGRVLNPDGTPAANAQVRVCTGGCDSGRAGYQEFNLTADVDGAFVVERILVGRLDIFAKSPLTQNGTRMAAQLAFEGDIAQVTVILQSVTQVRGVARYPDGSVAGNVRVQLLGIPSSGCFGFCTVFSDPVTGEYAFLNVPAHTVTITARHPVTGLQGLTSVLVTQGVNQVDVVLQPAGTLTGRVLTAGGEPAASVTVELRSGLFPGLGSAFTTTDGVGAFAFEGLATGTYTMILEDPLGTGMARRIVQVTGDAALGDIVLDEATPVVAAIVPATGAVAVARSTQLRLTFSESLDPASVSASSIVLAGPSGPVTATRLLSENDTIVTLSPVSLLNEATLYTVQVIGVRDRLGKAITPTFTSSFTTVDLTAPVTIDIGPPPAATGVGINTTVRLVYSEAIDAARFRGPPITVMKGAAIVEGRTDVILGNTVVVFTPNRPLELATQYTVTTSPAADFSGNEQPARAPFSFSTTDLTPPRVLSLTAAAPTVIEGTSTAVVADVGAADIAVVDFYVNGVPAFAARTRPFTFAFEATPAVGAPGDRVTITALATDTSGLRGTIPATAFVDITADQPPSAAILAPAEGTTVRNGDRITVTVRATDDVGAVRVAYRAGTGQPQDAESRVVAPPSTNRTETFAFNVPAALAPGATIDLTATVVDTKGRQGAAPVVRLVVADATDPTVTITGTSSGARVRPGTPAVAVVAAQDLGGIASVRLRTVGVVSFDETRVIDPAQPDVATAFTFPVPASARPTDTIRLEATAFDRAGNSADAAAVILSIEDLEPPRMTVRTASGANDAVIGATVQVIVEAEDEIGVSRIDLRGAGAFVVSTGRSISPPRGTAVETFEVSVPATAAPGAILTLDAVGRDVFGNTSAPVTLALTLRSVTDITLPASLIINAGDSAALPVALSAPAPAEGLTVALVSTNTTIATVSQFVTFAAGETVKNATLSGVSAGLATIRALVAGVERGSMTATVQGAVLSGVVFDPQFQPVAGAQVTLLADTVTESTTTDAQGRYQFVGFPQFNLGLTVRAFDPVSGRVGVVRANLNRPHGFAVVDIVLIPAGSIAGTVTRPDGTTAAGAGARVDLIESTNTVVATTFTDENSRFEFDLVSLGSYRIEVSDTQGNRGRTTATLETSGQALDLNVSYLGRGTVTGTVRSGVLPIAGARVRLFAASVFGQAPIIEQNTAPDGTFRFDDVFVGTITVQGIDPVTSFAGLAAGEITADGQELTLNVTLSAYGVVRGTVYRADQITTVPGAEVHIVTSGGQPFTFADAEGRFSFAVVPVGDYSLFVRHPATRGLGRATGAVAAQGQEVTTDVALFPQGTILATVRDATGNPVPGATVSVQVHNGQVQDSFEVTAGAEGIAVIDHVLAGSFTLTARSGGLSGTATGTVGADAIVPVTIDLEPTASIEGTVLRPDGQTPASGSVRILAFNVSRTATLDTNGRYRIDGLPLGYYEITAFDAAGLPRARIRSRQLTVAGGVDTVDLRFAALGLVAGRVINPNGTSAGNLGVTLRSLHADFGGYKFVTTNAGGFYEFVDVYEGDVVVTASDTGAGVIGEVTSKVVTDGATLTLDIQLVANAIRFPITKFDASYYQWDTVAAGSIQYGTNSIFGPAIFPSGGAFHLDLAVNGVTTRFAGNELGTTELGGRQLVTRQNDVGGLNVTRKVYVPRSHFARYMEILSNPTAAPITATVRLEHFVGGFMPIQTVATSSGDATLNVSGENPDRWILAAIGAEGDPFGGTGASPTVGWTFDGPNARRRVSTATIAPRLYNNSLPLGGRVAYEWTDVTIAPGETVAFMHFGVQQTTRAAGQASMDRLVQLAPEALDGLSPLEIGAIQNFDVPANGLSALAALPPLGGTITGRVFNADGTTPVRNVLNGLRIRSTVPVFARAYGAILNNDGAFTLADGALHLNGVSVGTVSVPIGTFTIVGAHPQTQVEGPSLSGAFPPGFSSVAIDYVYSNTAMLRGRIRRTNGTIITSSQATVTARRTSPFLFTTSPGLAADGTYSLFGLPPGTFDLIPSVPHPQGTALTSLASVTVAAGDVTTVDITLQATGTLTGVLRTAGGVPVAGNGVSLKATSPPFAQWSTGTNASGVFTFADVAAGTYSLESIDNRTFLTRKVTVTVVADQTTTQDLTFAPLGTVTGRVLAPNGTPVPSLQVSLQHRTESQFPAAFTNAQGVYTFSGVAAGEFVLSTYEQTLRLQADALGRITAEGQTLTIDLQFQGVPFPASLTDFNGFRYDVQNDGQLFGPVDAYRQGYSLLVSSRTDTGQEVTYSFPGRISANTELQDRQLVIRQNLQAFTQLPAGLVMTRKIFVPGNGYFVRYLEIFENTGLTPFTIDARVHAGTTYRTVYRTSSGDQTFDAADRWVITDNGAGAQPVLAHVFGGPGAALQVSTAGIEAGFNNSFGPAYRWNGLTIEPGQRVILMHFGVQQFDRDGAQASVDRLQQLPPEALSGLTAEERAAIGTFAVPADGSSPLAPFSDAQETITVTGRVFAHDGVTPVAGAPVEFGSASRIFGAPAATTTNANGDFSLTRRAVDRYALEAHHPLTGVRARVEDVVVPGVTAIGRNVSFVGTGTIRGSVRTSSGAAVAGATVQVFDSTIFANVATAADGTFAVSGLPGGPYTVRAIQGARVAQGIAAVAVDTTTIADLVLPALATVRATVQFADSSAAASAIVYIRKAGDTFLTFGGFTDVSGVVLINNVPEGPFEVSGYRSSGGLIAVASGLVASTDEGQIIDVLIRPLAAGNVTGRVFAGDGVTTMPQTSIEVIDVATGEAAAYAQTDANGQYLIENVSHGAAGLRVVARGPNDVRASVDDAFTVTGETLTIDLTLPLAAIRGAVFLADGVTPASNFEVEVAQPGPDGDIARQFPRIDGHLYRAFVGLGPFTVAASDSSTGATTSIDGVIADVTSVVTLDVSLPPTGVVTGTARAVDGTPLAFTDVVVSSVNARRHYDLWVSTDASGAYRVERVPLGEFSVQVCQYDPVYVCGTARDSLDAVGETSTLDVTMPATGTVSGAARLSDGSPLPGFYSYVRVLGGDMGPINQGVYAYTYGTGAYQATVAEGPVTALFRDQENGAASGVLAAPGPLTLDVTASADVISAFNAAPSPGADGFEYSPSCDGTLRGGEDLTPYSQAYALRVAGHSFGCLEVAKTEINGRQAVFGPYQLAGLETTRRVFVPAQGGFARYLETFTNHGAAAITVDVQILSSFSGQANAFVASADTGHTFAVTVDGSLGASGRASAAHVFAGPGAAVGAIATVRPLIGDTESRYQITVPAGGTVTLMHFAVQRAGNDPAAARTQAEALSALTDPNALVGMSPVDRVRVVNFVVP